MFDASKRLYSFSSCEEDKGSPEGHSPFGRSLRVSLRLSFYFPSSFQEGGQGDGSNDMQHAASPRIATSQAPHNDAGEWRGQGESRGGNLSGRSLRVSLRTAFSFPLPGRKGARGMVPATPLRPHSPRQTAPAPDCFAAARNDGVVRRGRVAPTHPSGSSRYFPWFESEQPQPAALMTANRRLRLMTIYKSSFLKMSRSIPHLRLPIMPMIPAIANQRMVTSPPWAPNPPSIGNM